MADRIPWLVNSAVMADAHCRGPGQGPVLGTMGFCIMLCTVHTTQGQGTIVTACKRSLAPGNAFTPVWDSVHGGRGLPTEGSAWGTVCIWRGICLHGGLPGEGRGVLPGGGCLHPGGLPR